MIQECEDPERTKHEEYIKWANNFIWIGDSKNKGIGIFAKEGFKLKKLNWSNNHEGLKVKHFLPCIIDEKTTILGVWTHYNNSPKYAYIGQLWKYMQVNKASLKDALIIGDFNSNSIWDKVNRDWNHSDVVKEFLNMGIESFYHLTTKEEHGKESQPTFFLHRNLKKSYHLDYIFGNKDFKNFEIGEPKKWLEISDHLPIICDIEI